MCACMRVCMCVYACVFYQLVCMHIIILLYIVCVCVCVCIRVDFRAIVMCCYNLDCIMYLNTINYFSYGQMYRIY